MRIFFAWLEKLGEKALDGEAAAITHAVAHFLRHESGHRRPADEARGQEDRALAQFGAHIRPWTGKPRPAIRTS